MSFPNPSASKTSRGTSQLSLRLYVAGQWPRAEEAKANLKRICAGLGPDQPKIDIVDVFREPEKMLADDIIVTPTLVRLSPMPVLKILGTLSDPAQVRRALGVHTFETAPDQR